MRFNFKKTNIYKAVKWRKTYPPILLKILSWLFFLVAIFLFLLFLGPGMSGFSSVQILGFFVISVFLAIKCLIFLFFLNDLSSNFLLRKSLSDELNDPLVQSELNLARFLDFEIALAIHKAINFCESKGIPLISLAVMFFIRNSRRGGLIFDKLEIDKKSLSGILKQGVKFLQQKKIKGQYAPEFLKIIERSATISAANFHRQIEIRDFLVAAAEDSALFKDVLAKNDLNINDVDHVSSWEDFIEHDFKKRRQFWRLENLRKIRGIGKKWAAGYTINLDKYSIEINKLVKREELSIHLISHKKEIDAIERVLAKSGANNVLLVGRPGVGRSTIAYAFAKKISFGRSFSNLNDKRVLQLDMQSVLAGLDAEGEILERLKIIFSEAVNAGNVILIIDEIHNFLGNSGGPGSVNIESIIAPYLSSTDFQVLGITNYEGWHKCIENNPTVKNLFVKVEAIEPDAKRTIFILEDMLPGLEKRYGISVSYKALRDIVFLTGKHIQNTPFPEKAIDVLTEVLVYAKRQGEKEVLKEHVNQVISERTEIPVGKIQEEERVRLLDLENIIHKRIINQKQAVAVISEAMRRARTGMGSSNRPIGTFLFLGPTGVGKTETSKALAEAYFSSEKRMIRFDMSEYQQVNDINRLIGFPEKGEQGVLTKAILDDPFSLLLLDEVEKTHPNILNLFLQVFDEGWLTDAFGKKVSFTNSIIIATSNAGSEFIRERVKSGFDAKSFTKELTDYLLKNQIFRPEFLNRFDAVVTFQPLEREHLIAIAKLMLNNLTRRLYEGMGIRLSFGDGVIERVADLGYQPEFGARPMRRVIQDKIESQIAKKILEQRLKRGDSIEINTDDFV